MAKYIFLLFLIFNIYLTAQKDYHLVINPKGHKGQIRKCLATKDGKYLITGGFDKTIKVWNWKDGIVEREILGQIGVGSEGMIYDFDLNDNDSLIAVGGWFGNTNEGDILGDIRIYNFKTGKIIRVLKGHSNVILSLKFVNQNQLLAADGEQELFLWDFTKGEIIQKYHHSADTKTSNLIDCEINEIAVSDKFFFTADEYGFAKKWDYTHLDSLKSEKYYEGYAATSIDYNAKNGYVAMCADTFMTVYDENLKPIWDLSQKNKFAFVKFSEDGKILITGVSGFGDIDEISLFYFDKENKLQELSTIKDFRNSVITGCFINDRTIALCGGDKDEIRIYKLDIETKKATLIKEIIPIGLTARSVAIDDKQIAFGDVWTAEYGLSDFNKYFNLLLKSFAKPEQKLIFNKPEQERKGFELKTFMSQQNINSHNSGLNIKYRSSIIDSVIRTPTDGSRHNVFTFLNDNYFLSGGAYGTLIAYDLKGNEVTHFIGHTGDVLGASISADGKRLITSSFDRTMKIWSLDNLAKTTQREDILSVMQHCKNLGVYESGFDKIFKELKVDKESKERSYAGWEKVISEMNRKGYPCTFLESKLNEYKLNYIYPIASIFIDEYGEWIIWNEKGYFTSSKNANKYVGYHLNHGKDKEAEFFPFEQFDLKYNRPDIIMKDLELASLDIIEGYYLAYLKRLKKMEMTEEQLSDDIHLPELEILSFKTNESTGEVTTKFKAIDDKYKLDRINVYLNDVPIYGVQGISLKNQNINSLENELKFNLIDGRNKVQISVLNDKGAESLKQTKYSYFKDNSKHDLYIVSIGVSEYKDKKFNLNYAAKDAIDMANYFKKARKGLYNEVYIKNLVNSEVSLESIKKIKDEFLSRATPSDAVIIFVAGHGVLDKNLNYYFGAHNMDFENPANGGIPYEELEALLNNIRPINKLFFMDSCHSGELDKDDYTATANSNSKETGEVTFRAAGSVNAELKKGMNLQQASQLASETFSNLRRGTGATIISSAGGAEYALESKEWKNGLFTYSLLNGLTTKAADKNKDGKITVSEIEAYVYEQVNLKSKGAQKPTSRAENLEIDFRIW